MRTILSILLFLVIGNAVGQVSKLQRSINRPGSNSYLPVISGDGQYLLYRSNVTQEGEKWFSVKMTSSGQWTLGEIFDETIDVAETNPNGGFFLNFDATELFFTSKRYGSMGGFDIWSTERNGNNWTPSKNAGRPVNSNGHEGDPSLSADGKTLYFMRCESITSDDAKNCSLWMANRKSNGYFNEPVKLPSPVNTGHETTPLILADNVSLVFASSRPGGKGGLDLYLTRNEDGEWSEPVPLDFLNTEKDDRYISIPVRGDIVYYTKEDNGEDCLFKAIIPEDLQPYKVLWLDARVVSNNGQPVPTTVQYAPLDEPWKITTTDDNGIFSLILKEGPIYDLAVIDRDGRYTFSSKLIDLSDQERSRRERNEFVVEAIRNNTVQVLNNISFKEYSSELDNGSDKELQRLIYLMQKNPQFKIEIDVFQNNYLEDTVLSNPDLTEMIVDTLTQTKIVERLDTLFHEITAESLLTNPQIDSLMADTTLILNPRKTDGILDSLNRFISEVAEMPFEYATRYDTLITTKIKYTFHNDRSQDQAQAVVNYLIGKGAPPSRIIAKGIRSRSNLPEDKKPVEVKAKFYQ